MVRLEWKSLFKNKILLLVVAAIITIPTIYTTLFLGSMWDPYGKVDHMPVAVVNLDKAVTYEGKELKVGEELVENLKDNDSLDFHFTDADDADEGIRNGKYYMVITIPEDFSANAATLMDEQPKKMQLTYATNPGTNYIAMKMSESAMQKIKTSVAEEVTRTYTETVFDQLTDIGDGMQEAADGAGEIEDGVQKLSDGNQEIYDNLQVLADSTLTFKDGSNELTMGLKDYTDGVVTLRSGAKTLAEGTGQLNDGAGELVTGVNTLNEGASDLNEGVGAFADGTKTLANGAKTYVAGTEGLANGTKIYVAGTEGLAVGAKTYVAGTQTLANGAKVYVSGTMALASGIKSYINGTDQIQEGMDQLAGLEQLGSVSDGIARLNGAVSEGSETTPALKDATDSLSKGLYTMYQQVSELRASTEGEKLSALAGQLGTAAKGIGQAADGIEKASGAIATAADSAGEAEDAATTLADSLKEQVSANNDRIGNINHQIDTVNDQIGNANGQIADAKRQIESANSQIEDANSQIEKAKKAVRQAKEAGALDEGEADKLINALDDAMADKADTDISSVSEIDASDLDLKKISIDDDAMAKLGNAAGTLKQVGAGLKDTPKALDNVADALNQGLDNMPSQVDSNAIEVLEEGLKNAYTGAEAINKGMGQVAAGLQTLEQSTTDFPQAAAGVKAVRAGLEKLTANNERLLTGADELIKNSDALTDGADQLLNNSDALAAGADQLLSNSDALKSGADQLLDNSEALKSGADQLLANADAVASGASQVADGVRTLATASGPLVSGIQALDEGAVKIYNGTKQLAANNGKLLSGSQALTDGAEKISDGAGKLADGSGELGDGLKELGDGSTELSEALSDGANEIHDIDATDEMMDMFAAPVDADEVFITEIANNGHAMSAYMMSVALWVGCIAFCIMYPLMKYEGKIRSGFDWWASKASVLFTVAVGMALVMLGMLHICNGFEPANWGQMIAVTCLASIAFMSIMYFMNVLLGKVGSFLMLIFMVVQLAGAAGTYPVELSGEFVADIHPWLPFSYTVDAFRVALAGAGNIHHAVMVLIGIIIVFTLLTINLFRIRTKENRKGRKNLYELLEERGMA